VSRVAAQPPRKRVAVHARHADVEQRDIGEEFRGHLQAFLASVRDAQVVAHRPQQEAQ